MAEYNDGKALVWSNTGDLKILMNEDYSLSYDIDKKEIGVSVQPLSLSDYDENATAEVYPPDLREISILPFQYSMSINKVKNVILNNEIKSVELSDTKANQFCSLLNKSVIVAGAPLNYSNILPRLKPFILKKSKLTSCSIYKSNINLTKGIAISNSVTHKPIINNINSIFASVYTLPYRYNVHHDASICYSKVPVQLGGGTNILAPITVTVEDYKPPVIGPTGSGSGVSSVYFVAQKFSFVEINLSFTDCKVLEVIGLPTGLIFEKAYIKGTPFVSGTYPIQMKLDNNRILEGIIQIPEIPREL